MYSKHFAALAALLMFSGCASLGHTMKSNTFIGASLAATVGATSGAIIGAPDHGVSGALIGTAVGAVVGGVIGYLTEPKSSSGDKKTEGTPNGLIVSEPGAPKLTPPIVRKVWIEDVIQDGKYVQGHFIWVLERGSVWSMP
jgi:hypothetical protein